jgi:hypothetical protein
MDTGGVRGGWWVGGGCMCVWGGGGCCCDTHMVDCVELLPGSTGGCCVLGMGSAHT